MSKNLKILFFLFLFSLGLSFYIIFSINKIDVYNDNKILVQTKRNNEKSKVDLKKIKENYNQSLLDLISEIKNNINNSQEENKITDLEILKKKIVKLKSPSESYGEVHLNLILALNNLENYLKSGKDEDKKRSLALLNRALEDYQKIKIEANGI